MVQLKMFWRTEACEYPKQGDVFTYRAYRDEADIPVWVDICKNGLLSEEDNNGSFEKRMSGEEGFKLSDVFFVEMNGVPVATVTAIPDRENRIGRVHMVAAKPECRGRGVGAILNEISKARFYECGCIGADLTTDEFRVPAVRSYLRAGFLPVEYDEGMEERWTVWLKEQGYSNIEFIDENGKHIKYLVNN